MKTITSHFSEMPHTKLGWWSVGLSGLFVVLFLILQIPGFLTTILGVAAGLLTLGALIWKHERSWLIWLMLLPGLFAILLILFFTLGEIFLPH